MSSIYGSGQPGFHLGTSTGGSGSEELFYFYLKTRNDLKDHLTSEETFSALSDNDEIFKYLFQGLKRDDLE